MKFFRPLLILGLIAIAIAVFSLLLVPGWLNDPLSLVGLLIVLSLGALAVYTDLHHFWQDLKRLQSPNKPPPEDNSDPL